MATFSEFNLDFSGSLFKEIFDFSRLVFAGGLILVSTSEFPEFESSNFNKLELDLPCVATFSESKLDFWLLLAAKLSLISCLNCDAEGDIFSPFLEDFNSVNKLPWFLYIFLSCFNAEIISWLGFDSGNSLLIFASECLFDGSFVPEEFDFNLFSKLPLGLSWGTFSKELISDFSPWVSLTSIDCPLTPSRSKIEFSGALFWKWMGSGAENPWPASERTTPITPTTTILRKTLMGFFY